MKKIGLVIKNDDRAAAEAEKLRSWLEERNLVVYVDEPHFVENESNFIERTPLAELEDLDLVVVLGGDGTLLYAARTWGVKGVPLLGVNMGGLGFLTEISLESLNPTLEKVLVGDYSAESRMMLTVTVQRGNKVVALQNVLNDAVINKGALARILNLDVSIDRKGLTSYRADGLIISTPTGSTAYNLAAGGPIIYPTHETIILTPICPFTLSNRPLILPTNVTIEITMGSQDSDVLLTADGQISFPLEPGDTIRVERSKLGITLIKNPYKDYFEILRTKLGWG